MRQVNKRVSFFRMHTFTIFTALGAAILSSFALPQEPILSRTHRDNDGLEIDPYGVAGKLAALPLEPPVTEEGTTTEEPMEDPIDEPTDPEEPPLEDDTTTPMEPELETEATPLQSDERQIPDENNEKGLIDRIDACRRKDRESLLDVISDQIDYIKRIDGDKRVRRSAESEKNSLLMCSVRELLKEGNVLKSLAVRAKRSANLQRAELYDLNYVPKHASMSASKKNAAFAPTHGSDSAPSSLKLDRSFQGPPPIPAPPPPRTYDPRVYGKRVRPFHSILGQRSTPPHQPFTRESIETDPDFTLPQIATSFRKPV